MLQIMILDAQGQSRQVTVADQCVVGKGAQNEVRLESWRIGKEHARLFRTPGGVLVEDMGAFGGVSVNGQRIELQHGPLLPEDVIGIGPYRLQVLNCGEAGPVDPAVESSFADTTPVDLASRQPPHRREDLVRQTTPPAPLSPLPQTLSGPVAIAERPAVSLVTPQDARRKQLEFEWRKRLHVQLLETMDLRRQDVSRMSDDRLRRETETLIRELLQDRDDEVPAELDRELLCRQVLNEAIALGPLEELLEDDGVTEIMVNRYDEIYVERSGRLHRHPLTFTGDRAVMGVIERIVAPLGRRIDESSPMVDARLKDGSRVNAIIPPLALKGPTLTIRKFSKRKLQAQDLIAFGSISPPMAAFLHLCVEARKNIVVSGGTGSGKTTLLNILSNFIPPGERVITVEDAAELKLHHEHLISLEARPENVEGKGAVTIRELVRNTLRMRPDRIVVGECRGAEALDMLQAMNTGHEGSLTTLHANAPRDALARLETMVLMAGMELPLGAIREQIASAVDIIVQQTRFACGTRMVTHVVEITGMESGKIQVQELFRFVNRGYGRGGLQAGGRVQGYFTGCDTVPSFYDELRAAGVQLDVSIFKATAMHGMAAVDELPEQAL
ncbi:ATPase, T2SS/T4P/T4SS family [Caldimonas brevitalea]|uniref:Secretion system protein E n=1 Tax=Caldimonas brevitalea TaxID=413882 RepID=A0A0G3BW90_9BURK|nr:ATPase, T2SS/T4P/T4SS family [Caldimonas brevitalea]AKJ31666.1 secretion system protein E [Caldimonas brevitalea]